MQPEKRKFPILAVIAVVLCVLAAGMLFLVLAPGPRLHWALTMGEKYLTQGNYEQAVTMFTRAIQVDDRAEAAYLGRAEAYTQLGESEAAETDLTFVIDELGTDDAQVYLTRAAVYDALQQPEKAQTDRTTAQEMGADVPETDTTDAAEAAPTPEPTATPEPTRAISYPTQITTQYGTETVNYYPSGVIKEYSSSNSSRYQLDEHGNRTSYDAYNDAGELIAHDDWVNQYDSNGRLLHVSLTATQLGHRSTGEDVYTYNEHGDQTYYSHSYIFEGGSENWTILGEFEYDDTGRILHELQKYDTGETFSEATYTYTADSYTKEEFIYSDAYSHRVTVYTSDGIPQHSYDYSFESNVPTSETFYNEDGNPLKVYISGPSQSTSIYTYDEKGRVTECIVTDESPELSGTYTYDYTYDSNGNVIRQVSYKDGEVDTTTTFTVLQLPADYKFVEEWQNNPVYVGASPIPN